MNIVQNSTSVGLRWRKEFYGGRMMYYKLTFNVVERIKMYMEIKGINAYQLTAKTQLSENTIPNLLKKKDGLPRLDTLLDILQALNVSLSEFFGEQDRQTLEPEDQMLLNHFHELDDESQHSFIHLMSQISGNKKQ